MTFYNESYDADNQEGTALSGICASAWEVIAPNGTTLQTGTSNTSIQFTPAYAGKYTVNLTVTDNEGDTATTSESVVVDQRTAAPGKGSSDNNPGFPFHCEAPAGGGAGPAGGSSPGGVPEAGGEVTPGTGNNHAYVLDPVSTRGYPLTNNIHINSQTRFPTRQTALGNASFTYGIEVRFGSVSGNTHYFVIDADGGELDFGPTSANPQASAGIFSTLNLTQNGYELIQAGPPESIDEAGNYSYEFDQNGKLLRVIDPSGNEQEVSYDQNGDIVQVEDLSSLRTITFEYDTPGTAARVVEGSGAAVIHLSYTNGKLSGVSLKDQTANTIRELTFTYNANGLIERIRRDNDADTDIEFSYVDAGGGIFLANFEDQDGYSTNLNYFSAPSAAGAKYRTTRQNAQGGEVIFDFDANYNLLEMTLERHNGASFAPVHTYTYGANRLLASESDGATTTTYQYNALGLPTQVATTGGQTLTMTYNGADILTEADQNGTFLTFTYTDQQNPHQPTTATDAAGNTWNMTFNAYGQMTELEPPAGSASAETVFDYEEDNQSPDYGYLRTVTNGEGEALTLDSYSLLGDVTSVTTSPSMGINNTTQYEYDPARRLTELTFPDSITRQWSYSGYMLDSALDENASVTSFEWCKGCGKPKQVSSPLNKDIQWAYTNDRALAGFIDALTHQTSYTYGDAGELTREDYPDGSYYTYEYDDYGRFKRRIDSRGAFERANTRDAAGRVTLIDYNNPWQTATTFTYYADDRLNEVGDESGITTHYYDSARRIQRVRTDFSRSGLTRIQEVEYTYYPDNLVNTMAWRDNGNTVATWTYTYDGAGRMTGLTNTFGDSITYVYDDEGKLVSQTNGNGTSTEYEYYQPRGWVNSIVHKQGQTPFASYALEYDDGANTAGNLTETSELDGSVVSYDYDDLYRLVSEVRTGTNPYTLSYGYDLAGNVTTVNGSTFATYDSANKFATVTGGSATHDAIGDLTYIIGTGLPSMTYTWNARSEVRSLTQGATTLTYKYNARRQRSFRDTGTASARRWFVYAGDKLLGEIAPTGAQIAYTWGADGLAAERLLYSNASLYYHFGPQGESRYLSDSTGARPLSYLFTAYGKPVTVINNPYNRHRFGGKYGQYFESIGPVLAWHRWYEPQAYRWLNRDPISYDGGDNTYAYVGGNPVNLVDPDGLIPVDTTWDGGTKEAVGHEEPRRTQLFKEPFC